MSTVPKCTAGSALAVIVAVALLSGCEGLSEGNRPVSIAVSASDDRVVYRCFVSSALAAATFTDGTVSDFTARVTWSSSDPGVVEVSNGDIEVGNSGSYYAAGTLIARNEGTATIQGDLISLSDSLQIEVKRVADFYIEGESTVLAPGSDLDLTAYLVLDPDSEPQDFTNSVIWSLPSPDGSLSVGASSGVVEALAPGAPQQVQAGFGNCSDTAEFTVQARSLTGLRIDREYGDAAALAVGTSERYTVYGQFDHGPDQNLSDDVEVTLLEQGDGQAILNNTEEGWYLTAIDASFGEGVEARFDSADLEAQTPLRPQVERDFDQLDITPADITITDDEEVQVTVIATERSTGVSQTVTRHVAWALDVDDVLSVDASQDLAGRITPLGGQDGIVEITAGFTASQEHLESRAQVQVLPSAVGGD